MKKYLPIINILIANGHEITWKMRGKLLIISEIDGGYYSRADQRFAKSDILDMYEELKNGKNRKK